MGDINDQYERKENLSEIIQIKALKLVNSPMVKQPFRIVAITLLSLLVPLSFLLLARVSCARFLVTLARNSTNNIADDDNNYNNIDNSFVTVSLYFLVSLISVTTLVQTLSTAKIGAASRDDHHDDRRDSRSPARALSRSMRLHGSWIVLCALQACVGAGINGAAGFGTDFSGFGFGFGSGSGSGGAALFSKVIFFVGLHETMQQWCHAVVGPVVDDTLGSNRVGSSGSDWAQRGALAGGFGSLWYWRLRDEVEALVTVPEIRAEMLTGVGFGDFAGWWLYYLTVTVGMVRVVKGLMWLGMSLFRARSLILINHNHNNNNYDNDNGSSGLVLIVSDYDDHDDDHEKARGSSNVDVC